MSETHWEQVYSKKSANEVSWFQPRADLSLKLIAATDTPYSDAIIDVGGGASTLVDDLLKTGYSNLTVLDLSAAALQTSQLRLGEAAAQVQWIAANITTAGLPEQTYAIWHDRAVFHFLTTPAERQAYIDILRKSLKPGGHVIIATFAEDGPMQCSGLPVMRYSPAALWAELGSLLTLIHSEEELHYTPFNTTQKFIYCYFKYSP
ncbi:class I SAM-dependent methyltransferase [Aquirhabdus sp.]|uniref:class I SAM-dependent methyltransferase n=1 Tax=Aquirhabdus sp. TaxID=2824160 RepID=UPI00396C8E57